MRRSLYALLQAAFISFLAGCTSDTSRLPAFDDGVRLSDGSLVVLETASKELRRDQILGLEVDDFGVTEGVVYGLSGRQEASWRGEIHG